MQTVAEEEIRKSSNVDRIKSNTGPEYKKMSPY